MATKRPDVLTPSGKFAVACLLFGIAGLMALALYMCGG
jgi:hypothetical protein